jgi:hypothetical protein
VYICGVKVWFTIWIIMYPHLHLPDSGSCPVACWLKPGKVTVCPSFWRGMIYLDVERHVPRIHSVLSFAVQIADKMIATPLHLLHKHIPYHSSPRCMSLFIHRVQISAPTNGYPDWHLSWLFSFPTGECWDSTLKLFHNRFLPNPFQLIIIRNCFFFVSCCGSSWFL